MSDEQTENKLSIKVHIIEHIGEDKVDFLIETASEYLLPTSETTLGIRLPCDKVDAYISMLEKACKQWRDRK